MACALPLSGMMGKTDKLIVGHFLTGGDTGWPAGVAQLAVTRNGDSDIVSSFSRAGGNVPRMIGRFNEV